jgi:hypothetical protein
MQCQTSHGHFAEHMRPEVSWRTTRRVLCARRH